jgi:hypothetical protein
MAAHASVTKAAGSYATLVTIGMNFLQSSHDTTGSIARGMNSFYAEELPDLGDFFAQVAVPRDTVVGNAMELLYDKVIAVVTDIADQTPPAAVGRIAGIVRQWRFKYEFTRGKLRNLPRHDAAPGAFCTFLNRAVDANITDLQIYVQTEDFFQDPDPMLVITYRNFEHFSNVPFAVLPGGGAPGAAPPRFYFNPAAIPLAPRERYEKRLHSTRHMRGSDLVPYTDTGLKMNYYADAVTGQYYVLRDGTLFELKDLNEKVIL